jgi:lathosterol oxidase
VQFVEILVLTDLAQYWIHRAFHAVPALWRFHRIHHSAETMDWLAGSRLHLVDVAVTRGLTYVPIYVLGFSQAPLVAYVAFVSAQATFIHANVRFRFGALGWLLATPRFHHSSRRRSRSGRQEFRRAPARHRLAVRDVLPANGSLAGVVRPG